MGCDVHIHIERKIHNNKHIDITNYAFSVEHAVRMERVHYFHANDQAISRRDYHLFAQLAGVRNYGNLAPITEPKGLPDDVSTFIKETYEYDGDDAHSCSWLTAKEIKDYIAKIKLGMFEDIVLSQKTPCIEAISNLLNYITNRFKEETYQKELTEEDYENLRIVFWFDN